jgi:HK97 family phage prohead protease
MDGSLELAMTHHADGRACQRPTEVRAMVGRLHAWDGQPETCKSCVAARAVSVVSGEALCRTCRQEREVRLVSADTLTRVAPIRSEPATGYGLVGHPIVFDSWSVDLGGFIERVRPQAVNRLISGGADVRALWNHNSDIPLGRSTAKTMRFWKDDTGVVMALTPPKWAGNYIESIERGDVSGMSFGFVMLEDEWFMDGTKVKRDLFDMRVSEYSAVAFPAYPATDIRVGAASNRVAWLEKVNRNRAAR